MKLIDADKMNLLLGISDRDIYAKRMLDHMDTVDAVPVTRCKDCEHYDMGVCLKIYSDGNVHPEAWQERNPDDFAATANRRRGNEWTLSVEKLLKRGRLMCASVAGANSSKGL